MCELGLILGLATGIASAAGEAETARANQELVVRKTRLEHAAQAREFIVESKASQKEAYDASLERDRGIAFVSASGGGARGNTAGLQIAEQHRQGSLSIDKAQDRQEAAEANYIQGGWNETIVAHHKINAMQPSPAATFAKIATSAVSGYGAFG